MLPQPLWFAMRLCLAITGAAFALLAANTAHAQQCPEFGRGSFEGLDLAQVKPGQARVGFSKSKAFVVPGDLVLVSQVFDASACAAFVNAKGQTTTGLLPSNRLETPTRRVKPEPAAFVGLWKRTEASISIKRQGRDGAMAFSGAATYGALDRGRVARGAVNTGDFSFTLKPDSNKVDVSLTPAAGGDVPVPGDKGDPADCAIAMMALGPYLVVEDNGNCGGANVSFTGVYRRND